MNDETTLARFLWGYAALIAFGFLGIHRFILGRPVTGIVYALTGGLGGAGLVFDFFIGVPYMVLRRGGYE